VIRRKNAKEIELMRRAGAIASKARALAEELAVPGATTKSIDREIHSFIKSQDATPAFLGYRGYPASCCISVNDEVIHGMPSSRTLENGDIVSIDVGVVKDGYVGDCAATFIAGAGSEEAQRLIDVTRECFYEGIKFAKPEYRVSDISEAIQQYAEGYGFSVVRDYVGHGIGSKLHEAPEVPNFVQHPRRRADPRLYSGMTLAIEPMINAGTYEIKLLSDGWTVVTRDGKLSAHYENTILITDGEPEILTTHEGSP